VQIPRRQNSRLSAVVLQFLVHGNIKAVYRSASAANLDSSSLASPRCSCPWWLNAIVESDSQVIISLSYLESPSPWSLAALVDDIRLWAKNRKDNLKSLRYEDTIHNINNSKQKTVSKNKSNSKEYVNSKESDAVRDGEINVNLEPNREEGEVIRDKEVEKVLNKEGIIKEKCVNVESNGIDSALGLNAEENLGVFGTDDYEVNSSNDSDNNTPTSPLQGNNGNNCSPNADGSLPKPVHKSFSYASMVKSDAIPNSLDFIPTLITEFGNEVVIFDEEIVQKGSERWCLTVCGHFVGYDMHINELSFEIGMNMVEPKKLPVWVKLSNVSLEAWCVKGISAMASSLGKPILMDTMTAIMCYKGIGNFGYARVLVEMDPEKDLKSEIEIQYVDNGNKIKGNKKGGDVLSGENGTTNPVEGEENDSGHGDHKADTINDVSIQGKRKQYWNNRPGIYANQQHQYQQNKKEFRRKQPENANNVKNNVKSSEANYVERNKWKVKDNVIKDIRSTANKYSILDSLPEDNDLELKTLKERMIVDKFLNEKIQPTLLESITWSKDMIKYFKDKLEIDMIKESEADIEEDVLEVNNSTANVMRDKDISGIKEMFLVKIYMEYKIRTWNIRGMNTLEKQNEVINLIRSENLKICAVLETRLKSKKLVKACDRVFQRWSWVSNMQDCIKGCRIVIGWDNDETSVQVIHKTSQSIFCVISARKYNFKCFYTFVDAANEGTERRCLWEELVNEKRFVNGNSRCVAECLNKIEVEDISRTVLHFTWTKNLLKTKAGSMTGILKKLDRVMSNEDFIGQFPNAHAKFLPYIISDHTPSVLCIPTTLKKKHKAFRFSNFITEKQEFLPLVKEKWSQDINCVYMYQVVQKMKKLKSPLNHLGWSSPCEEFHDAEADEEKFLWQHAKIKWLSEGDKNNSYFHKVLKGRNNKSKILSLNDSNGNSYEEDQIPNLFLKHFEEFIGTSYPVHEIEDRGTLFQRKISNEAALNMIAEFSDKEIMMAMFDIEESKAPGPDGFTSALFKKAWDIIGTDICNAVKEFFRTGRMLGEVNATLISLIPKIQTPNKVTDFRPIACCNVLHKCISKAITNRIKHVLGMLVSNNQSAFISGRSIQDNILLTQEIIKGYNRKGGPKRVAFKIDLQKAYDSISWSFLKRTLEEFGFHDKMVNWIMQCATTAGFSINVNGERVGAIKLTHVCFADDLLVMCYGDSKAVMVIKSALDEFSACSGLMPNNSKSSVFFGSLNEEECCEIKTVLPFATGSLLVRYLGVPLIAKRLSVKDCRLQLINQSDTAKGKAKIAWKNICKPKDQGGLGLKNLHIWNKALLAKHVWNIATKKDSLWVKCVHSVKLRGKNIWEISADVNDSWEWRNLLCIRDLIRNNVKCIIRNGNDTSIWFDNWCNLSLLSQFISYRDLYDERLGDDMKVSDMLVNDRVVWRNKFGKDMDFSVSIVNTDLNEQGHVVPWWKLMWFSQCIPKPSFILWLAVQNRLNLEDLNHLMFQCSFAKEIWNKISLNAEFQTNSLDLMEIIQYLIDAGNGNNIKSIIRRIAFAASVYGVWTERNGRIFKDSKRSCDEVVKSIIDTIRNKLLGIKVKDTSAVRDVERKWAISCNKIHSKKSLARMG
ncbi:RNA-directed DNA polymerase, eukaryota, reverse transcriptase zinc-binding domain protein, partial [Tanacetum coccineum]